MLTLGPHPDPLNQQLGWGTAVRVLTSPLLGLMPSPVEDCNKAHLISPRDRFRHQGPENSAQFTGAGI